MPLIDMPLQELWGYKGISPCPQDIDSYWDDAILEMKSTDPEVELVPSDFQTPYAECFDLYFTGVRGARVHAKFLRPKNNMNIRNTENTKNTENAKNAENSERPYPAVLQFHGYTGNCGDWSSKLAFAANGMAVAALDCRGQGGESEDVGGVKGNTYRGHIIRGLDDKPENLLFRHIFLDAAQLAAIVMGMPEVDETRIGAMGGSQGGALTLACASLEPRIKRLAPVYPFLCDYKRVWEMDLAKNAYEELLTYFRMFDPLHKREDEIFHRLGYIDLQNIVKRIRGKVMMATGLMDTICPPSTQFAAYNKITAPKEVVIYPDYGHEPNMPGFADMTYRFMLGL